MVLNFVNKRTTVEVKVVRLSSSRTSIAYNCTVMSWVLGSQLKFSIPIKKFWLGIDYAA